MVYANTSPSKRRWSWSELDMIETRNPWLFIGDFNCTLSDEERSSFGGSSNSFLRWTHDNDLIDLGFVRLCFTWNHGRSIDTRRSARLDRALCNDEGQRRYPKAGVKHPHFYSNHCPLLLQLNGYFRNNLGSRPFCFEATRMTHGYFKKMLAKN